MTGRRLDAVSAGMGNLRPMRLLAVLLPEAASFTLAASDTRE